MSQADSETFGPLLHGTARAWRLKLDQRLKPMGLSQAKWRTLLHLSLADGALTQSEIASRLGVEEPTLVNLLHRLERAGWVARKTAPHDRRCKTVHLRNRAQSAIEQINATAADLRNELLSEIPPADLRRCMEVLERITNKAEKVDKVTKLKSHPVRRRSKGNGRNKNGNGVAIREATK
ncbi:MAG: MarR family transcriptional regulator, transcriptional regulator for hemolysin [Verrucomicrobiota bacterium]|jgi:MarR family transcriptional regulator for hemolysin